MQPRVLMSLLASLALLAVLVREGHACTTVIVSGKATKVRDMSQLYCPGSETHFCYNVVRCFAFHVRYASQLNICL